MKTMTCKQLGGACDKEFHTDSFEDLARMSKQHGTEMFQKGDKAHIITMNKMRVLMQKPKVIGEWFENKKKEFDALPDDK